MRKTDVELKILRQRADHFAKLAAKRTAVSSKLASLVLAAYCGYEWSGDRGGPTLEMVQLAEKILGTTALGV